MAPAATDMGEVGVIGTCIVLGTRTLIPDVGRDLYYLRAADILTLTAA